MTCVCMTLHDLCSYDFPFRPWCVPCGMHLVALQCVINTHLHLKLHRILTPVNMNHAHMEVVSPYYGTMEEYWSHRHCNWCNTPTGRWCDYCEHTYTCPHTNSKGRALCSVHDQHANVGMCRQCFAALHGVNVEHIDALFDRGPGPWATALICHAWYDTPEAGHGG